MTHHSIYFYGNKISDYGIENNRVDYRTFAQAFEHVLNNDIMNKTWGVCGEWGQISGFVDNSEEIEQLQEQIKDLEDTLPPYTAENISECSNIENQIKDLENQIEELENEQDEQPEIYQYYIVSNNAVELLQEANEIVFYNDDLDMYVWGVTHWGTSWDYVLTDIKIEREEE